MKEPIDKYFKDKLHDHESELPAGMWAQISGELDTEEKKKPVYWYWTAVVLVLLGTSLFFFKGNPDTNQFVNADPVEKPEIKIDTPQETLVAQTEDKTEVQETPQTREQLVAPMLAAFDSRTFAIGRKGKTELMTSQKGMWDEIVPEYKKEGKVFVKVQLANRTAGDQPESNQKKSLRDHYKDFKESEKKIKIPTPKFNLAEMFASK